MKGGDPGHREPGRGVVVDRVGYAGDSVGFGQCVFAEATGHHAEHPVTDRQVGHAGADGVDHTGTVTPNQRLLGLTQAFGQAHEHGGAAGQVPVGGVDRGNLYGHRYFAGVGFGGRDVLEPNVFESVVFLGCGFHVVSSEYTYAVRIGSSVHCTYSGCLHLQM